MSQEPTAKSEAKVIDLSAWKAAHKTVVVPVAVPVLLQPYVAMWNFWWSCQR